MLDRLCYAKSIKTSKRTPDANVIATAITERATDKAHIVKNPAAVALGRLGGLKGDRVRAERLTSARRVEIANKAAWARWGK